MMDHLTNNESYKKLEKYPSNKVIKEVSWVINESSLDEGLKKKLTPRNCLVPQVYGLPKIHKDNIPLRPILNTIGSPTYLLEKFLANRLKPLVGLTSSFVKDSTHWVYDIK
jgi:hypothetical protein